MGSAERVLSERELNRALLARQGLLERFRQPLPKVLERIAGIQAQYAPAMYVGLAARVEDFERAALTRALERRRAVQGTLLRTTIHLVSAREWWAWSVAIREARREGFIRYRKGEPSARVLAAAAKRVRARLTQEGSLSRSEVDQIAGLGAVGVNAMSVWLDLVRVPPAGTWERRRADVFALAEQWIGPAPEITLAEARADLVRAYLRGFGPATAKEIAGWAGLGVKAITTTLGSLELRGFRTEAGEELVDLPRAPLPDPQTPAPVRFLPVWDATLLVHARRTAILPEEHRPRVFNPKTPHSVNTFLLDGAVAGTWKHAKDKIEIDPFRRLDAAERRALEAESERVAELHA